MTSSNFIKYMHHFAKYAKPTPKNPVLLLLDNHESHISVEVLDFCKEVGIVLMTFPPHCSHKLQSLDLTVYGPLKNYYNRALTDWMISNPGKTVTIYEIPKLAAIAIPLAFKLQNIQKGFEKPLNSNTFSNEDFICSSVIDQDAPVTNEVTAVVTSEIVRPYPKACPRKLIKNVRKEGKTRILTDSPEKRLIELAEQEKQTRTRLKERGMKKGP